MSALRNPGLPDHMPPHCAYRRTKTPALPGQRPAEAGPNSAAAAAPGPALVALLGELDARGLPACGMMITRLQGTLTLPDGLVVRYCCGWLVWPAGRPSSRGRPLHILHSVHDPAGAARRLTRYGRERADGME